MKTIVLLTHQNNQKLAHYLFCFEQHTDIYKYITVSIHIKILETTFYNRCILYLQYQNVLSLADFLSLFKKLLDDLPKFMTFCKYM